MNISEFNATDSLINIIVDTKKKIVYFSKVINPSARYLEIMDEFIGFTMYDTGSIEPTDLVEDAPVIRVKRYSDFTIAYI